MKIKIRNYRGVSSADLEHNKITLIGGDNHAGKTSIGEALGAVLTGDVFRRPDILKKHIKGIVRDGAKAGAAEVQIGDITARADWPDCKYSAGNIRNISNIAAGMDSLLKMKRTERAAIIAKFINAEPTPADLEAELNSFDIGPEITEGLNKKIKVSGFDSVCSVAKEKGTKIKGQWEEAAGEKYGSEKAKNWYPGAFYSALDAKTEDELIKTVEDCQRDVTAGIAAAAVSGLAIDTLRKSASMKDDLKNYTKMLSENLKITEDGGRELQKELYKLTEEKNEIACPHCGGMVNFENGKLIPAPALTDSEIYAKDKAVEDIKNAIDKNRVKIRAVTSDLAGKEREYKDAIAAEIELKKAGGGKNWAGNLEDCRKALENAESDLKAWRAWKRTGELNEFIKKNKIIVDILAPSGLRQTKLIKALAPFNKSLAEIAEIAAWPSIRIDKDYNIFYGERLSVFCSTSEIFQINVVLQVALSILEKSIAVIIDGADIIVNPITRNGLFTMLLKYQIPAVVLMSLKDKKELPPLDKVGGRSYWIENGVLKNE